ncbi:hypothetical protein PV516_40710 [Streptomyces scabiei]|uniref:hypothetical protein n=1 Tax=Streptomyces scabiei TaxID=1930 RepID=UPI0029B3338A|nr:hypothetical protein [Streptomyces scabiei]MDX3170086.1 hypothetical protein [Streptomyces scabiei]
MTTPEAPPTITSTLTYTGNHTDQLTAWLADTPHHFDGDGDLVIDTPDGEIHPRPGSWLIRWTDDQVTVASPRTAHRTYGPEGIAGRLQRAEAQIASALEWADDLDEAAARLLPGAAHPAATSLRARLGVRKRPQTTPEDQS